MYPSQEMLIKKTWKYLTEKRLRRENCTHHWSKNRGNIFSHHPAGLRRDIERPGLRSPSRRITLSKMKLFFFNKTWNPLQLSPPWGSLKGGGAPLEGELVYTRIENICLAELTGNSASFITKPFSINNLYLLKKFYGITWILSNNESSFWM